MEISEKIYPHIEPNPEVQKLNDAFGGNHAGYYKSHNIIFIYIDEEESGLQMILDNIDAIPDGKQVSAVIKTTNKEYFIEADKVMDLKLANKLKLIEEIC